MLAIIQQLAAGRVEVPHHVGQRDPVDPKRQFVKQIGRGAVAERGQFLNLAQAEGKHAVEHRLVDTIEQPGQAAHRVVLVVVIDDFQRFFARRGIQMPMHDKRLPGHFDRHRAPRPGRSRRHVTFPPDGGEAVEDSADELH